MAKVFQSCEEAPTSSSGSAKNHMPLLCLVLASDGVWDNWSYDDISKFVLDPSCLGAVLADASGAKRVALSLMTRNATYAKRNFGNQADNATGIILYISNSNKFPVNTTDNDMLTDR